MKNILRMGITLIFGVALLFTLAPLHGAHADGGTTWNFAEGRIGSGFKTFYTVSNPTSNACSVTVKYLSTLDGATTSNMTNKTFTVPPASRYTVNANADVPVSRPATLSAIFNVCAGMTVERPMYMTNFNGVSSGTDTLGTTNLGKTWYFADVPTHVAGESFLAVLNPNDQATTVNVSYYNASGSNVSNASMTVAGNSRATFQPGNDVNIPDHVSAVVTSDLPIAVERPSYYGGMGASDLVGAPAPSASWYFAEGNTIQTESLTIANVTSNAANVTVTLKSTSGHTQSYNLAVSAHSQAVFDVNANNNFIGATSEVAADVSSNAANIVVQRHVVGAYTPLQGGFTAQFAADTLGATSAQASYQFAEGFTSLDYAESLALQSPHDAPVTVTVKLLNMLGHVYSQGYTISANSRLTVDINGLVTGHLAQVGEDARAYAVSMSVASDNGTFVAERSQYYHTPAPFETQGASSVVGFTGN